MIAPSTSLRKVIYMRQESILMEDSALPEDYSPKLGLLGTHEAISFVHSVFEQVLSKRLGLLKVTCPRFIKTDKGLQDDLAGTQTPVSFMLKHGDRVEVVHSLAKWKRHTLGRLGLSKNRGIITLMDAFRKDEDLSPIHSSYVDQWDWEQVISRVDRHPGFLKETVRKIYKAMKDTELALSKRFPELIPRLPEDITFIHTHELEDLYPDLNPKEREHKIAEKQGAVFISGIGHPLRSGKPHDLRAADYDDWSLNGDIVVWDSIRKESLELSSMGIRVDAQTLEKQLTHMGLEHRKELDFHKRILDDRLPLSIGGGIGRSRLVMFLLHKAHIGEVQSSVWPEHVEKEFKSKGVELL